MITTDTLHLGDCLELMKDIPDNSVDMVLCDLPYGKVACKWDIIIPFEKLWPLYDRVCKENAAIVLFANEPFTSEMILSNIKQYRQKLTWLKTRPTNVFNAKKQFMELAFHGFSQEDWENYTRYCDRVSRNVRQGLERNPNK